jgi:hypothetical protein
MKRPSPATQGILKNAGMRFVAGVRPLDALLGSLRGCLDGFPDKRRGINTTYGMGDIGMAAFSVFFMQSPSFLAHQRQFEEGHGRSNCTSLFGIAKIPSDNHIRDMLDPASPILLKPSIKSGTSMAVWTGSAGSAGTC